MFGEKILDISVVEVECIFGVAHVVVSVGETITIGGANEMRDVDLVSFIASIAAPRWKLGFEGFGDIGVGLLESCRVEVDNRRSLAELVGLFDEIIVFDRESVTTIESD